jgi:hypothetical protein
MLLNHLRKLCVHPDLLLQRSKPTDSEITPPSASKKAALSDLACPVDDIELVNDLCEEGSEFEISVISDEDDSASESRMKSSMADSGQASGFKRPRAELHHVYDSGELRDVKTVTQSILPAQYPADLLGSLTSTAALDYMLQFSTKLQFLDQLLQSIRNSTEDKVVLISNYTQVTTAHSDACIARMGCRHLPLAGVGRVRVLVQGADLQIFAPGWLDPIGQTPDTRKPVQCDVFRCFCVPAVVTSRRSWLEPDRCKSTSIVRCVCAMPHSSS